MELILFAMAAATGIASWTFLRGKSPRIRALRRLSAGQPQAPLSVAEGPAQLQGTAAAGPAPGTGEVLASRLLVEEAFGTAWAPILEHCAAEPFDLVSSAGRARVQPEGATLLLCTTRGKGRGVAADLPPRVRALMGHHGNSGSGSNNRFFRWTLFQLRQGDPLLVDGEVRRIPSQEGELFPNDAAGLRAVPTLPVIQSGTRPLLMADRPREELLALLAQKDPATDRLIPREPAAAAPPTLSADLEGQGPR